VSNWGAFIWDETCKTILGLCDGTGKNGTGKNDTGNNGTDGK